MIDWLISPWPWYVSGPLIGAMVPLLLLSSNKQFGISSTFRHLCTACLPVKSIDYFDYDWKKSAWSLVFVIGVAIGGFIAGNLFANPNPVEISASTVAVLSELGIEHQVGLMPESIFGWNQLTNPNVLILLVIGGFLVGFGTRYGNGCTSGHGIMGLSLLSIGSLVAVIGFFIGGLITTHLIFPTLF